MVISVASSSDASAGGKVARSAVSAKRLKVLDVLRADGIGSVRFGASPQAVRTQIDSLLGQPGSGYRPGGSCDLDHQMTWTASGRPALIVYFRDSEFAGYQFGDPNRPRHQSKGRTLATTRGLRLDDALARGRQLYGHRFSLSAAQGGSWILRTTEGRMEGYAWGRARHSDVSWHSVVLTIDAGDVGCAAATP